MRHHGVDIWNFPHHRYVQCGLLKHCPRHDRLRPTAEIVAGAAAGPRTSMCASRSTRNMHSFVLHRTRAPHFHDRFSCDSASPTSVQPTFSREVVLSSALTLSHHGSLPSFSHRTNVLLFRVVLHAPRIKALVWAASVNASPLAPSVRGTHESNEALKPASCPLPGSPRSRTLHLQPTFLYLFNNTRSACP